MKRRDFLSTIAKTSASIPFVLNCSKSEKVIGAKAFEYRSMAFHGFTRGTLLDKELIKVGSRVGFNDITLQDDHDIYRFSDPVKRKRYRRDAVNYLTGIKQIFQENDYFTFLKEQGMTLSTWIHELDNYEESWGPVTVNNDMLWGKLSERYRKAFGEIFPELDNVILTVTESGKWIVQPKLLEKLVTVLYEQCKKCNMNLILRTFTHNTMQRDGIMEAIDNIPDDVIIMTKSVPQDWGMRGITNPVIGKIKRKKQYIEADTWGEYCCGENVANCRIYTEFKPQYDYWVQNSIQGFNVRVTRGGTSVLNNAQEANIWFLGYSTSGKNSNPDKALEDFTVNKFGSKSAKTMAAVLRHTGDVVAEAMYIKEFSFGKTAFKNPTFRTTRSIWCKPALQGWEVVRPEGPKTAAPYPDDQDLYHANPFNNQLDPQNWDKSYYPIYQKVRKGDPQIIKEEVVAYQKAVVLANNSLQLLEKVKDDLPNGGYDFFKFKLDENKCILIFMNEMQLAWLKAEQCQYTNRKEEIPRLEAEISVHLKNVQELYDECKAEQIEVRWQGRDYELKRFSAYDVPDTLAEFKRFWMLS